MLHEWDNAKPLPSEATSTTLLFGSDYQTSVDDVFARPTTSSSTRPASPARPVTSSHGDSVGADARFEAYMAQAKKPPGVQTQPNSTPVLLPVSSATSLPAHDSSEVGVTPCLADDDADDDHDDLSDVL